MLGAVLGHRRAVVAADLRRRSSRSRRAESERLYAAAAATYCEQVLTAFQDVEDQLAALRLLAAESGTQSQAVDAATRATRLSDVRWRNGRLSRLELR